jgi:hypothetical protein
MKKLKNFSRILGVSLILVSMIFAGCSEDNSKSAALPTNPETTQTATNPLDQQTQPVNPEQQTSTVTVTYSLNQNQGSATINGTTETFNYPSGVNIASTVNSQNLDVNLDENGNATVQLTFNGTGTFTVKIPSGVNGGEITFVFEGQTQNSDTQQEQGQNGNQGQTGNSGSQNQNGNGNGNQNQNGNGNQSNGNTEVDVDDSSGNPGASSVSKSVPGKVWSEIVKYVNQGKNGVIYWKSFYKYQPKRKGFLVWYFPPVADYVSDYRCIKIEQTGNGKFKATFGWYLKETGTMVTAKCQGYSFAFSRNDELSKTYKNAGELRRHFKQFFWTCAIFY